MNLSEEKIKKLIEISRLYYEQDKTQSEIAELYRVSRPLVSRMLREAKESGIVRIEIGSPLDRDNALFTKFCSRFQLSGGAAVKDAANDNMTNDAVSKAAIEYMMFLKQESCGIGWGHIIGHMINYLENGAMAAGMAKSICPLIGNSGVANRNYHSNELVRIFAHQTGAVPNYIYAPALVPSKQEQYLIQELENYKSIFEEWNHLDAALVNIGNYPSVPDFASAARYGDILTKNKAVGRILGYFYDINGDIFYSENDFMIQIPLDILKQSRHIIGICSSNTKPKALFGAMKTGIISHLIAPESLIQAVIEY